MKRFYKSFGYAFAGIKYAFSTQPNFKFHSAAAATAIILGIYYRLDLTEWLWIMASVVIVLLAELINTAIEVLVDLVSPEYNYKAGVVKDLAAGAVLVAAIFGLIVGLLIFVPKLV